MMSEWIYAVYRFLAFKPPAFKNRKIAGSRVSGLNRERKQGRGAVCMVLHQSVPQQTLGTTDVAYAEAVANAKLLAVKYGERTLRVSEFALTGSSTSGESWVLHVAQTEQECLSMPFIPYIIRPWADDRATRFAAGESGLAPHYL